jgi:hypothetical protein
MATSIPSLKPDSEMVSGGKGIISEFPTLRILRVMTIAQLYNVIWDPVALKQYGSLMSESRFRRHLGYRRGDT